MCVSGEIEKRSALVLVGLVRIWAPFDLALAAVLLFAPLARHFLEEGCVHESVELIDAQRVIAVLKPLVFTLVTLDRVLVLAALIGVAGMRQVANPFLRLVVEAKSPEQFGELRFERVLANVFAAARCRITPAFIGVTPRL